MLTYNFDAKAVLPDMSKVWIPGPATEPKQPELENPTVGKMIYMALNDLNAEKELSGADRYKRAKLAIRVLKGGDIDIDDDERKVIKDAAVKYWMNAQALMLVWDALENGKPVKAAEKA